MGTFRSIVPFLLGFGQKFHFCFFRFSGDPQNLSTIYLPGGKSITITNLRYKVLKMSSNFLSMKFEIQYQGNSLWIPPSVNTPPSKVGQPKFFCKYPPSKTTFFWKFYGYPPSVNNPLQIIKLTTNNSLSYLYSVCF